MKYFQIFIVLFCVVYVDSSEKPIRKCVLIKDVCADQGYAFTDKKLFMAKFNTQTIVDWKIRSFESLFSCSNYLKAFLCGVYKPPCYEESNLIVRPCKSMCEHVHTRCSTFMSKLKIEWRQELNCSNFLNDDSHHCMNDDGYAKDSPLNINSNGKIERKLSTIFSSIQKNSSYLSILLNKYICYKSPWSTKIIIDDILNSFTIGKCVLKCNSSIWFSGDQKKLANTFNLILSLLSLITSSFAIHKLLHKKQLVFDQTNILLAFVSMTNLASSSLSLYVIFIGKEAHGCQSMPFNSPIDELMMLERPLESSHRLIIYVVDYYFRMSSISAWFLMAFIWFLNEKLTNFLRKSEFILKSFTLIPLILAALQCIGILISQSLNVDINELTGTCFLRDRSSILRHLIRPYLIYIGLGVFLFLIGLKGKGAKEFVNSGVVICMCSFVYLIEFTYEVYVYYGIESWINLPKSFEIDYYEQLNVKKMLTPNFKVYLMQISLKFLSSLIILCYSVYITLKLEDKNSFLNKPNDQSIDQLDTNNRINSRNVLIFPISSNKSHGTDISYSISSAILADKPLTNKTNFSTFKKDRLSSVYHFKKEVFV